LKLSAVALSISPDEKRPHGHVVTCPSATYEFLDRDAGTVKVQPHRGAPVVYDRVHLVVEAPSYRQLMRMIGRIHFCGDGYID